MRLPPYFGNEEFPEQEVVLHNEHCVFLVLANARVLPGSGLIVPFASRATVFDLTPAEWSATQELLLGAKEWIDENYRPAGYNVGWNNGPIAGQSIPQIHLHVIPRFEDEPLAGQGIRYHLKQPVNMRPGRST